MRNIKARFERSVSEQPNLGDYIHLAIAVRGQNFSKKNIGLAFSSLVPKDQYEKRGYRVLLNYLVSLSKGDEEVEKSFKKGLNIEILGLDDHTLKSSNQRA